MKLLPVFVGVHHLPCLSGAAISAHGKIEGKLAIPAVAAAKSHPDGRIVALPADRAVSFGNWNQLVLAVFAEKGFFELAR